MSSGFVRDLSNETIRIKDQIAWKDKSFYEAWQEAEGVPVHKMPFVEDVRTVSRWPWHRLGGRGAYLNLANQQEYDVQLLELGKEESSKAERHVYEELIFVLEGSGSTDFWQGGSERTHTIQWKKGSLFSPPLNAHHQHSSSESSLLLAVTNLPQYLNRFRNLDFIYNNDFAFSDRFSPEAGDDYFSRQIDQGPLERQTNFVEDVMEVDLQPMQRRGEDVKHIRFSMCDNSMAAHIHQVPVDYCDKAHRHGPGAHVLVLQGQGYEEVWYEGEEKHKYNFSVGSIVSPAAWQYHHYCNTGTVPLKQLALRGGSSKYKIRDVFEGSRDVIVEK